MHTKKMTPSEHNMLLCLDLTAAETICTKSAQDWAPQSLIIDWGGTCIKISSQIQLLSGREVFKNQNVVRGGKTFHPTGKLLKLRK